MHTLFPHYKIRPVQSALMDDVRISLDSGKNLIAHAPTGLGKTAAALSVGLKYALDNKKTLFFLTNRHTQHRIAIETLRAIKLKHKVEFVAADLIGKQWMCLQEGVKELYSQEFMEYCKTVREQETCSFYTKLYHKNSLSTSGHHAQRLVMRQGAMHVRNVNEVSLTKGICPYYFTVELAKSADVIISDYNTLFHPSVRQSFLSRVGKDLASSVVIVDEAHNLAERLRSVMSIRLSSTMISRAVSEAEKFGYRDFIPILNETSDALNELYTSAAGQSLSADSFVDAVSLNVEYESFAGSLEDAGAEIRATQKRSFLGSVGEFLRGWINEEEGYVRFVDRPTGRSGSVTTLHNTCLDASQLSGPIFNQINSSVVMSGTLNPTEMFRDVLGIPRSIQREYASSFPTENRLTLVVPETSTRYKDRGTSMYNKIAGYCAAIIDAVPGNSVFFFPSYAVRDEIANCVKASKRIFLETSFMRAEDKSRLLEDFKSCKNEGAALFAVAAASFSEGIDLPGDYLKAAVVVGLPLAKPDVQTKALIQWYQQEFGKGWEYGYIFPAMTKCVQAAGRVIRSETDRGLVLFLDQRFVLPQYFSCLPPEWDVSVTRDHLKRIKEFFK
jgi:DNA excision repair protein ERCC-2